MPKNQRVLLTTSRKPTSGIRTLCRDISRALPNIWLTNRGKLSLEGIAEKALELDASKAVVIDRWDRGLALVSFFEVGQDGLVPVSPIVFVRSAKFRRDFEADASEGGSRESVAIVASSKENPEAAELERVLSGFFGVPILSLRETRDGKYNVMMQISADSSKALTITFKLVRELNEIGPQINVSHLAWK